MKRKVIANLILAFSFFIIILSFQVAYSETMNEPVQSRTGVITQLCMIIDGSDSIGSMEWDAIKEGLAEAIETAMPRDGAVELTIVQFGYSPDDGYAKTEVPPTVMNSTNHEALASQTLAMTQGGVGTPMAHGLYLGWKEISNSPNFDGALYQIINLATDGEPNRRNLNATSDLNGDGFVDQWDDVIAVVDKAVDEGLEELDIEGIGIPDSFRDWFREWVVHPQPGILAPPF
ncbi:MAG: VWA domain-containing protein, partial [Candidatus Bathyarchaeota archaeon]